MRETLHGPSLVHTQKLFFILFFSFWRRFVRTICTVEHCGYAAEDAVGDFCATFSFKCVHSQRAKKRLTVVNFQFNLTSTVHFPVCYLFFSHCFLQSTDRPALMLFLSGNTPHTGMCSLPAFILCTENTHKIHTKIDKNTEKEEIVPVQPPADRWRHAPCPRQTKCLTRSK